MPLVKPFAGLRPAAQYAHEVVAPPYDVLNSAEARQRVQGKPWSFLHISKPEIDLPEGVDPFDARVYQKAGENLQNMLAQGILVRDPVDCYYLYRIVMGEHEQTGLVAAASVAEYDCNRVRKHEFTRPDKEDDRVRQIQALNAQTGPVFLVHRRDQALSALYADVLKGDPAMQVTADDGVSHTLWVIDSPELLQQITQIFDQMACIYVADGHHRSAAASRVAKARQAQDANQAADASYNYFLSVIFPDDQMNILDYNRVVKDLHGLSESEFMAKVATAFDIKPAEQAVKPQRAGEFGMYLGGKWYQLNIHSQLIPSEDPVASLDVSLLANHLIEPILGISDPRRDYRIDFVGGIRGLSELEKRVDQGDMVVAFSMFPTSMQDLMAVADADKVMPPKSTWFEPKLADGLVSHVLD